MVPDPLSPDAPEQLATPTTGFDPADPLSEDFRAAIRASLDAFLGARREQLRAIDPSLDDLSRLAADFTAGGKRLRPAFCYWGYAAVAGQPAEPVALLRACASLDLLHVSALIHDDVMDASDTRRGLPAAHRQLERLHETRGGIGDAEDFGHSGAILLGDLLLVWSVEALTDSGLDSAALARALPLIQAMRTEVTAGQYLDVLAEHSPGLDNLPEALARVQRVVEYKSARYTVQRPVQFGAALAGASHEVVAGLAGFGSPLGRAFQFRDDVLGVFGDEELTGKPAGDDLRAGKRTVLVARTLFSAPPADARELEGMLGNPDLGSAEVERARRIIADSGALAQVEEMIEDGLTGALSALSRLPLRPDGAAALEWLAVASVRRDA